jgi:hypothetical protein
MNKIIVLPVYISAFVVCSGTIKVGKKVKVKQSCYRPGVAQGVPGS